MSIEVRYKPDGSDITKRMRKRLCKKATLRLERSEECNSRAEYMRTIGKRIKLGYV